MINTVLTSGSLLMQGAFKTTSLWIGSLIVSLIIGSLCGMLRCNRLRVPFFSNILDAITFVFRGIPFFVQLLIAYFVIPEYININASAMTTATLTLGICSAAYVSNVIRGGINAIPVGQWEAAQALGFPLWTTIRYVIAPQALRNVLPALTGECDQLLKSTAVVSAIGVLELTGAAKNIVAREINPLSTYTTVALIYLLISSLLAVVATTIEQKSSKA